MKQCSNKNNHIRLITDDVAVKVDSFRNKLDRQEYKVHAKDKTIENLRLTNERKYRLLKDELKKRDIKIKDVISRIELEPAFGGNPTVINNFVYDTAYVYIPIDSTVSFNDGYLSALFIASKDSLSLPYTYRPGKIIIDSYRQRTGFLRPKKKFTSVQFANPNVDVTNVDIVMKEDKIKYVIGIGVGYGSFLTEGIIKFQPSVGIYIGYPLIIIKK